MSIFDVPNFDFFLILLIGPIFLSSESKGMVILTLKDPDERHFGTTIATLKIMLNLEMLGFVEFFEK